MLCVGWGVVVVDATGVFESNVRLVKNQEV